MSVSLNHKSLELKHKLTLFSWRKGDREIGYKLDKYHKWKLTSGVLCEVTSPLSIPIMQYLEKYLQRGQLPLLLLLLLLHHDDAFPMTNPSYAVNSMMLAQPHIHYKLKGM